MTNREYELSRINNATLAYMLCYLYETDGCRECPIREWCNYLNDKELEKWLEAEHEEKGND